jgi:hypothetical protein
MIPMFFLLLCVVLRVVPHPPNFAPVGAMAVFAGRTLKPWMAMLLVALAMFAGDIILSRLHGYSLLSWVTPFVYGGFFVQAGLRSRKGGAIAAAAGGSVAFFVLSNFGVWIAGDLYPLSVSGLTACYLAALPFFGGTLVGDVLWTVVLSLAYQPLAARLEARKGWVPVATRELAPL